jgi:hypothetical protein
MTTNTTIKTQTVVVTRIQYMDRQCSHHEYYMQFVTPAIRRGLDRRLGDQIRRSRHADFNDIPLREWDCLADWTIQVMNRDAFRQAVCPQATGGLHWSINDNICILKAAAKEIRDESVA